MQKLDENIAKFAKNLLDLFNLSFLDKVHILGKLSRIFTTAVQIFPKVAVYRFFHHKKLGLKLFRHPDCQR